MSNKYFFLHVAGAGSSIVWNESGVFLVDLGDCYEIRVFKDSNNFSSVLL